MTRNADPKQRKTLLRAGAFAMVALIVAVAAHGVYQYNAGEDARLSGSASEDAGALDPRIVLSGLEGRTAEIASNTDVDAAGEAKAAFGDVDAVVGTAEAHVLFVADDAQRTVAEATRPTRLAPVPEDFVPGMPVDVDTVTGVTYQLEGFAGLGAAELQAFEDAWVAKALQLAGDDEMAKQQIEQIMAEADGATGGQDPVGDLTSDPIVRPLWIIGESTYDTARGELAGAGAPTGYLPEDLGTDVGSPSELLGATDPAEAEAEQARAHAMALLDDAFFLVGQDIAGTAGAEIGAMGEYVAFIEAHQQGLVDIVNDSIEATHAELERQSADLQERAAASIEDVQGDAQDRIDEALATAQAKQAAVAQARADADAILESRAAGDLDAVLATATAEADRLRAKADDAEAAAAIATTQIDQAEAEALSRLKILAAQDVDTTAHVAEVEALAAEARSEIEAEARADAKLLRDQADALEAHARAEAARLQGHIDDVRAELSAMADDAVAETQARAEYAIALAQAEAEAQVAAHQQAASEALTELNVLANEHVLHLYGTALDLNAQAGTVLETAEATRLALLEDVGFALPDETNLLGQDLAIIEDVAEDCATSQDALCDADWEAVLEAVAQLQSDAVVASEFRSSDIASAQGTIEDVQGRLMALSLV